MVQRSTIFGSLEAHARGQAEIISGNVKHYAFSNIYAVAANSRPYEKVVVAKNLEYVLEAIRAEGVSPWYAAAHDEFVLNMDGIVEVEFVKLDNAERVAPHTKEGTILISTEPTGKKMGMIRLKKGHQAMLPRGTAYRFTAAAAGVLLQQTVLGDLSIQKWADICMQPQAQGALV